MVVPDGVALTKELEKDLAAYTLLIVDANMVRRHSSHACLSLCVGVRPWWLGRRSRVWGDQSFVHVAFINQ